MVTTIEQQIEILKGRGMDVGEIGKAVEHLMDIGYYRLGFYWYYYESNRDTHQLVPDIKLEDVIKLYYFDVDLRNILSRYLYWIEVHFRTQVVYFVSNYYSHNPCWFSDYEIVSSKFVEEVLPSIYNYNFKQRNSPIRNHHRRYPSETYAPAWKTLEFFTFGQVFALYRSLLDEKLKSKIAAVYGIKNLKGFENYIGSLINIRNICSHSAVLFGYNQPTGIRGIPDPKYRVVSRNRTNLIASLNLILFILSKISENRVEDLSNELSGLFGQILQNPTIAAVMEKEQINISLFVKQ